MKELWNNLKFVWVYAKDQKKRLFLYAFCNVIAITFSIIVPILSARIIVHLTSNQLYQVLAISLVLLIFNIVGQLVHCLARYCSQKIYRETFTKIQSALGREILKLENQCIDSHSSGVFIQRLTNDTSKLADIFNVLNLYLSNIISNIGIFGAVFIINKVAFCYLLIMILSVYLIEQKRVTLRNEQDKLFRKKNEKVSGFVGELVRGVRDIKMLNAEESFMSELHNKIVDLNNQRYQMGKTDRNYSLISGCFSNLFDTGMIFLLVYLIMNQELEIANALVIHNYMSRVTSIVNYARMLVERVKDFNLSVSRIFAIIDSDEFKKEKFGKKHLESVEGDFEFKDVSFHYDDRKKVIDHLSFKVNANETGAFVGKSGAGKSTIFNLLCKMYDVKEGKITIDGVDIKELDRETIRGNITIINQNPYIFNLTIRDNLRLVKEDLTEEEMREACKMACLDEFIEKLPDKYDTIVGEGGISLSGGQRQRLAIARAFVQKTEIILFDEATSALDNETQASIQEAIENLKKDYTILIVAHRLSTVIKSDRIVFLNNGKIEAEGTHKELLRKNKNYKKLYEAEIVK